MTGIILLAFGKRGYVYAAHNLRLSIGVHSKKIPVTLVTDEICLSHLQDWQRKMYDKVIILSKEDVYTDGKIDPAKVKTDIYRLLPYQNNLYLDVDAILLKDINPFIDKLEQLDGFYYTDVIDKGGRNDTINYSLWATNGTIWEHFGLNENAVLPSIQSSWAFIRKNKKAERFFTKVKKNFDKGFDKSKLTMNWGGTLPDELFFSATCAQEGIIPEIKERPIFFGWQGANKSFAEIEAQHYLLSIYGNGNNRTLTKPRYLEWYDRIVRKMNMDLRVAIYKLPLIMQDKHANNK